MALFEQVARSVDPGFRLADHLSDVVGICRAVDGLPLAIELAAGHLRTLPPGQLRRRLSARLDSPSGVSADVLTFGGIVAALRVPDPAGDVGDVVLGLPGMAAYRAAHPYLGALIGRYANRPPDSD